MIAKSSPILIFIVTGSKMAEKQNFIVYSLEKIWRNTLDGDKPGRFLFLFVEQDSWSSYPFEKTLF